MPSLATASKRSRVSSTRDSRTKIEITINVYDLLPATNAGTTQPGRLSSILWTCGSALLHSGVVIQNHEYAYGGHSKRNATGVYYTPPRYVPPGGTFRSSMIQGFTFRTSDEIEHIVKEVSAEFLGPEYNLLTKNCNHFTSALCQRLTGKQAPAWLNRAASIGLALPCMVPREWVNPPDVETAEGELVEGHEEQQDADEGDESSGDERGAMLDSDRRQRQREQDLRTKGLKRHSTGSGGQDHFLKMNGDVHGESGKLEGSRLAGGKVVHNRPSTPPPRLVSVKDTSGREIPVVERAPVPHPSKR